MAVFIITIVTSIALFVIIHIISILINNDEEKKFKNTIEKTDFYINQKNNKVQTKSKSEKKKVIVPNKKQEETIKNENQSINNNAGDYSWVDELKNEDVLVESINKKDNNDNYIENYSWINGLNNNKNNTQNTGVSAKSIKNTGEESVLKEKKTIHAIPSTENDFFINNEEKGKIAEKPGQVPEKRRISPVDEKPYTIYVGLDFGTSSTKVAYRISGGVEKVIPMEISTMPNMHYAQPSLIAFKNNKILFGEEAYKYLENRNWDLGIRCVKMLFAGSIDPDYKNVELYDRFVQYCESNNISPHYINPAYWVIAYLVWIIRIIRSKLDSQYKRSINLNINICIPLDTYEKENLRKGFQKAINVVEKIGSLWNGNNDITLIENIAELWKSTEADEIENSKIHIVPEAVAQMACYLNSLAAENKMHGVIDFGSGTTDFSIFNLRRDSDGERCAYWLNAVTYPIGMYDVEKLIANNIDENIDYKNLKYAIEHSYSQSKSVQEKIKNFLSELWKQSRYEVWGEAYDQNPKQTDWERNNVKIFVCGGGSGLEGVKDVFKESWYQDKYTNWGPYPVEKLPVPEDLVLEGINYYDFPRIAVAYGLTTPRPKLHKYKLPKDYIVEKNKTDKKNYDGGYWGAVYIDTH